MSGLCIALLGAESTGKTSLAQSLAERLAQDNGARVTWVPEHLRHWCEAQGRTPRQDEQRGIAEAQAGLIEAAARTHDLVLCDTTPVMTAVYSGHVFGDHSLNAWACDWHRRHIAHTLVTALDLAWQADGWMRDGPQVRQPVDRRVVALLNAPEAHGDPGAAEGAPAPALAWTRIGGQGEQRLAQALQALRPVLAARLAPSLIAGLPR